MTNEGWHVVDESSGALWREYEFTKNGRASTLVFRSNGDELVVVSPHANPTARELDALREHGRVTGLVANNKWHHLGHPAWRKHFTDAVSYAPRGAIDALQKKHPDIPFRPIADLRLPDGCTLEAPPGTKDGETFLSIRTGKGRLWYVGDVLANIQRLPGPPVSWIFRWTDSAPGYRLFRLAVFALVKDKKALRSWFLERLDADAPALVVPAHGPVFAADDIVEQTRAQVERL